ncbi:hypothetical protein Acsp03_29330 [Actinomadura sp. NBRC 104412]|uniref:hypothetical protein n=1 Tax=Actinomadura sp. NBRC 104412 TaxID=3032203 RepID=UPI0024A11CEE|nr:hypothetical protein [Actinomadura sp. NBRC 104412]GLZ05467.1 hypothetical protein Acsp03_29330 [Actinomadura sp. NBRC 104412]
MTTPQEPSASLLATVEQDWIIIRGVLFPKPPETMTIEEIREHLFLPGEAEIEIDVPEDEEPGESVIDVSWPEDADPKLIIRLTKRIIAERMAPVA